MTGSGAVTDEGWSRRDFERIYAHNVRSVHGFLARRVGLGEAEDLTAQVFAETWRQRDRYDPEQGTERGWIFGIAANVARRHLRSEGTKARAVARLDQDAPVIGEDDDAVTRVDAAAQTDAVVAALGRLDDIDQDLLLLAGYTDLSMDEIAGIVGMPVGTVKSRLSRARSRLRSELSIERAGVRRP